MIESRRYGYLDGLRGLAILLVFGYHSFARSASEMPYGDTFSAIWIFKYGYVGVPLFFMLSGFLILQSLESSKSLYLFLVKRWTRLMPAMIIVTLIIVLTASLFPNRPAGEITFLRTLPGLLLLDDKIVSYFFDTVIKPIEGSFWSLFVEVKFYIIAAITYFWIQKKYFPYILLLVFFAHFIMEEVTFIDFPERLKIAISFLSAKYFVWFSIGALMYRYIQFKDKHWLIVSIIAVLFASFYGTIRDDVMAHLFFGFLFVAIICIKYFHKILDNRVLSFFGFISYTLYLIHENITVCLIQNCSQFTFIPNVLLPFIPLILLSCLAYLITAYLEKPIRSFLIKLLNPNSN